MGIIAAAGTAEGIIGLINVAGSLVGQVVTLASQFKATASEADQAAVDAALDAAFNRETSAVTTAEADLDAAAKQV